MVLARDATGVAIAQAMKRPPFDLVYPTEIFPSMAPARRWLESELHCL